ncbi:putative ATPase [Planoprotostelium fungivorum]|uniref:Putative ATPase n=1 Tax=Planoprotostelium fungivorum TaxID=1890364 RepID=A0A2P6MQY2_9EUKA|nr:putative ATPase [Planoprotostelium fungivorum]
MGQVCAKSSVAPIKQPSESKESALKHCSFLLKWVQTIPSTHLLFMVNVQTMDIMWGNITAAETLGYTVEELLERTFESITTRSDHLKLAQALAQTGRTEEETTQQQNVLSSSLNTPTNGTENGKENGKDQDKKTKLTLLHKSRTSKISCEVQFNLWQQEQVVMITCSRDKRAELRREGSKRIVKFANEVEVQNLANTLIIPQIKTEEVPPEQPVAVSVSVQMKPLGEEKTAIEFDRFASLHRGRATTVTSLPPLNAPAVGTIGRRSGATDERRQALLQGTSQLLGNRSSLGALLQAELEGTGPQRKTKPGRIMVCCYDNEQISIVSFLQEEGYEVLTPREETDILRELNISMFTAHDQRCMVDVMILDVDRTDRYDPMNLFVRTRRSRFPNELPIIFISGETTKNSSKLLQANDHLSKPVFKAEVLSKIKNLLYIKRLNDVQSCFVPREFLDLLHVTTITDIRLGKAIEKEMTIIFVDIRSFTTLSEGLTPEENFQFINQYLSTIGPIIRKFRGFIDKFMGDGTLALFPTNSTDALLASLEIQAATSNFEFLGRQIRVGVGVNTGNVMLGILGEDQRMTCDVISSAVNISSRLEELTKHYQCKVIASEDTIISSKNLVTRELDHVKVMGIKHPVNIYEVMCTVNNARDEQYELRDEFKRARELYNQKEFDTSMEVFSGLHEKFGDQASKIFAERCKDLIAKPPQEEWTDVFEFTHK